MKIEQLLSKLEKLNQVQYSLNEQLYQLKNIAEKLELFQAFDYLNSFLKINDNLKDDCIDSIINSWSKIEKEYIHEASSIEQLIVLNKFSVKFGLYDANDFIRKVVYIDVRSFKS